MFEWVAELPPTRKAYLDDSYLTELEAKVLKVVRDRGKRAYVVLDSTIYHPLGGGQPSDKGFIDGSNLGFQVKKALERKDVVIHWGSFSENDVFREGEEVKCRLDWDRRYLIMKLHTAGHILDYAMSRVYGRLVETLGAVHGPPDAYLDYKVGTMPDTERLEKLVNEVVKRDLPVEIIYVSRDELEDALFNAPNLERLPEAETYRIVRIEGVNAMPCMGTHVRKTGEIGRFEVRHIEKISEGIRVHYWVS